MVVGTAGHIDHGKTELVKALTGINTDRLKEEKERGISIELGYAYLKLPSGITAGFIDVPGHERLVRKMIAGSYGIDVVLLVIDANEGVMPQTREHLDILDLLGLERGILVITKKDLLNEEELLNMEKDVSKEVRGTFLEKAPMVFTSAYTGEGLGELVTLIDNLAQEIPERDLKSPFRLFIDRIFSLPGYGTIVTGTSYDGKVRKGDVVQILPEGLNSRVRSIEVHNKQVDKAVAGERVALNLPDVKVEDLERGDVICTAGFFKSTTLMDIYIKLLPYSKTPELKHGERIRFYAGSKEIMGRVYLSKISEMKRGEEGFAQISLEESTVTKEGDRFVIRTYSPIYTIGGGRVIEPYAIKRKRKEEVDFSLDDLKDTTSRILRILEKSENLFIDLHNLSIKSHFPKEDVVRHLKDEERILGIPPAQPVLYVSMERYKDLQAELVTYLSGYHRTYPQYRGVSLEEVRNHLKGVGIKEFRIFIKHLLSVGLVDIEGEFLKLKGHRISFPGELLPGRELIYKVLKENQFSPPDLKEIVSTLETKGWKKSKIEELIKALMESGEIVRVSEELIFLRETMDEVKKKTLTFISEKGEITPGDFKELVGVSRKYAIPLLEWLDSEKITYRDGNVRRLRKQTSTSNSPLF